MEACTIRKTNIRSEFSELVIRKKNNCLFASDLHDNLHWWVIPRLPGRVFSGEIHYPAASKDMQALSGWVLAQGK